MRVWSVVAVVGLVGCGGAGPGGGGGGGGGGGFTISGGGGGGGGGGGTSGCGASSCPGCCFNGACQPGSTAAACGKSGVSCATCATNQICRVDQTCGVDPESTWRVAPTSATIAPNNNGSNWDGDGSAPDVVISLWCPATAATAVATTEVSSYAPTWLPDGGCTAKAKELLAAGFDHQAIEVDVFSNDTITARANRKVTEGEFTAGELALPASGGLQGAAVKLTKQ